MLAPIAFYDVVDEGTMLASSIGDQARSIDTSDCVSACNALASMRRSVERLCALDPGTRCTEARTTLASSETKVRAKCPACAIGTQAPGNMPKESPPPPAPVEAESVKAAGVPASERPQGGCLGCSTSSTSAGDFGALAFAMMWMVSRLRRRS